jgi:nucleotide sugar dehydrogenase
MKIAVIGMGKIGLPLAVQYARKCHDVIGVDINAATVQSINEGLEPFPEEAHLQEYLSEVIKNGKFKATLDYQEAISDADAIVVVVPLFVDLNAQPDFKAMDSATENIGKHLKPRALVCYETTLPIGTTRNRFTPALEKISGMRVGEDFSVVFSPERVFTGRIFADLRKYPKIVGGVTQQCTRKGKAFYESVLDFDKRNDLNKPNGVWSVQSSESAEFVKLAETTYRDLNIALANQFAMYAEKINVDIFQVIESANSQNFAYIHQPGISVGGHCIPVYPQFYLHTDPTSDLVRIAREINSSMPKFVVTKINELVDDIENKKILILGLSYRPGVKEFFNSGAFELRSLLEDLGGEIFVLDPLYTKEEINKLGFCYYEPNMSRIDIAILHTAHTDFIQWTNQNLQKGTIVIDGRNFLKNLEKVNNSNFIKRFI